MGNKEEKMGAIRDFEASFNRYLDEENATFEDAQKMLNHFCVIRANNEKAKRDAANREIERQMNNEAERVENEQKARRQELLKQQRDNL
jgi:ABC-type tungstate transport system permease subunit